MRSRVNPAAFGCGVLDRDEGVGNSPEVITPVGLLPSPSRTRVSIDFSRLPPSPLKTAAFLFSSVNPISRSLAIFKSVSSARPDPTDAPKTRDSFFLGGNGDYRLSTSDLAAASRRAFELNGTIEAADLKPLLLPV